MSHTSTRAEGDPLLAAHNLTAGSLHFGRSSLDELHHARAVGAIGAAMCVPPALYALAVLSAAAWRAWQGKWRSWQECVQ